MNDIEVSSIDLVEGGNVFKQGHYLTLGYVPRDENGETVDLSGKTLNVALWGRKGVVFEAAATFSGGVIRFTLDKTVPAAEDYTVEFTATSSTDAKYRKKFPANSNAARIAIKQSADDLGAVGISVFTIDKFEKKQKELQDAYRLSVDSKVETLEADFEQAVGALTVDSEVVLARGEASTLRARLDAEKNAVTAQLADMPTKDYVTEKIVEVNTGGMVDISSKASVDYVNDNVKLGIANVMPNSDFSSGTTEWTLGTMPVSVSGGNLIGLANDASQFIRSSGMTFPVGARIYVRARIKATTSFVRLADSSLSTVVEHPGNGEFADLSFMVDYTGGSFHARIIDVRSVSTGWDEIEVEHFSAFNVTGIFNGKTPTLEEMDKFMNLVGYVKDELKVKDLAISVAQIEPNAGTVDTTELEASISTTSERVGEVEEVVTQQKETLDKAKRLNNAPVINFKKWKPLYKDTFGDLSRWSVPDSTAVIGDDSDNFTIFGEDTRENGALVRTSGTAMKFTKTDTVGRDAKVECVLSQPIDITDHHALLKYYLHEGSGNSTYLSLASVTIMLYDINGGYAFWSDEGKGGTVEKFYPGWRTRPFRMLGYSASSTFDPTQITKINLQIKTLTNYTGYTPSITFDSLEFMPKLAKPIPYLLTFDGGYTIQKKTLAYLSAKGIRAHLYPTFDRVGEPGRMTLDDFKEAEEMGHIVGFHERADTPTGFYSISEEEKILSVQQGIDWMRDNGFRGGVGFAPLATQWWGDKDDKNILMSMLEHVRIGTVYNQVLWNPRKIGLAYDTNSLTLAEERVRRQEAKDRGTIYAGCIHEFNGGYSLEDFFTSIDEALADPEIVFVTAPELMGTDWYNRN